MYRKLIVAGIAVIALTAGCSSDKPGTDLGPATQISGLTRAECAEYSAEYSDVMDEATRVVSYVDGSDPSEVRAVIKLARAAVATGRDMIAKCGHYAPAEALALGDALDAIEAAIDSM